MFNVGGGELLVIMLVALVVLGPQKLPEAARKVGNAMGELRKLSSGFQAEMRNALSDDTKPGGAGSKVETASKREKPTKALKPGTTAQQEDAEMRAIDEAADEPIAELAAVEAPAGELAAVEAPAGELAAVEAPGGDLGAGGPTTAGPVPSAEAAEAAEPSSNRDKADVASPVAGNGASADAETANEGAGPASGPRP